MASSTRSAEKQWHEELYRKRTHAELVVPIEIRDRYLRAADHRLWPLEMMFKLVGDLAGKRVLCLGCGDENATILLALKGAEVWAVDLSHEATRAQRQMAVANRMERAIHPVTCAAEELPFPDQYFDVVFGTAVLHHLPNSLPVVAQDLARVLRKRGFAVFTEPVARSRLMRKVRGLFPPPEISPGERQLTDADLSIFARHFHVEEIPFQFLARLNRFVLGRHRNLEYSPAWRKAIVLSICRLDRLLLRAPSLRRFAGALVLRMEPRPNPTEIGVTGG